MRGLLSDPTLRMEMINFSLNHPIGPKLEKLFAEVKVEVEKGFRDFEIQKLPQIKAIEKVILDEFGQNVKIDTMTIPSAAIIPFHLNDNSIFLNYRFRGEELLKEQKEARKIMAGKKGYVDPTKGKVGGLFSDYVANLFFHFNALFETNKLSVREAVAVILHELGHGYEACAKTAAMDTSNEILLEALSKAGAGNGKPTEIIMSSLKANGVDIKKEVFDGLTSTKGHVFLASVYQIVNETVYSQMEDKYYSATSFEQVADAFATRLGYGAELITALEKLGPGVRNARMHEAISTAHMAAKIFWNFILSAMASYTSIFMILAGGVTAFLGLWPLIWSYIKLFQACIMSLCVMFQSGEKGRPRTYDDMVHRYNRIRQQMIAAIKNKHLTKTQAEHCIRGVAMISELIKDCKPYRGPLDFLFNTFNPGDRKAKASAERQRDLEDLMHNELFVASMQLRLSA